MEYGNKRPGGRGPDISPKGKTASSRGEKTGRQGFGYPYGSVRHLWRGDRVDGIRHGYPVGTAQRKSGGHGNRDMDVCRICRVCGNLYGDCPGGRHVEAACRAVPEICKDHGRKGFLPIGRAGTGCQEKRSVCPEGFKGDDRQGMVSGRTFGRAGNLFYADGRSLPDVHGCAGAVKAAQGGGRTAGSAA